MDSRQRHTVGGGGSDGGTTSGVAVPGKSTLTSRLSSHARVQRRAAPAAGGRDDNGVAATADAAVARAASSTGSPLPAPLQQRFEGSLGTDLSGVRVHTGGESAEAAQSVGARAYTIGQDIHFAAGTYAPTDPFGVHLLAHEVAHTAQQAAGGDAATGRQHKLEVSAPGDAAEVEADRAADAMVAGRPITVGSAAAQVQRANEGEFKTDSQGPAGKDALKWGNDVKVDNKNSEGVGTSVGASKGNLFVGRSYPVNLKGFVKSFPVYKVPCFVDVKPVAQLGFEGDVGKDGLGLIAAVTVGGVVSANVGVDKAASIGVSLALAGEAKEAARVTEAGPVVDMSLAIKGTGSLVARAGSGKAEFKFGTWTIAQTKIKWTPDVDSSSFLEDSGLGDAISALETVAKVAGVLGDVADAAVDFATDMIPGVGLVKRWGQYWGWWGVPETSAVVEDSVSEQAPTPAGGQSFDNTHALAEPASPAYLQAKQMGTQAQAGLDRAIAAAQNANGTQGRWTPAAAPKYGQGYTFVAQAREAVPRLQALVAGLEQRVGGPEPAEVLAKGQAVLALCESGVQSFTAGDRAQGIGGPAAATGAAPSSDAASPADGGGANAGVAGPFLPADEASGRDADGGGASAAIAGPFLPPDGGAAAGDSGAVAAGIPGPFLPDGPPPS